MKLRKTTKKQTFFITMLLIMLVWVISFEPIKNFFNQLINGVSEVPSAEEMQAKINNTNAVINLENKISSAAASTEQTKKVVSNAVSMQNKVFLVNKSTPAVYKNSSTVTKNNIKNDLKKNININQKIMR